MVPNLLPTVAERLVNVIVPKLDKDAIWLFTVGLSIIHSAVSLEEL